MGGAEEEEEGEGRECPNAFLFWDKDDSKYSIHQYHDGLKWICQHREDDGWPLLLLGSGMPALMGR